MRDLLLTAALIVLPGLAPAETVTVFAAASLKTALDQIAADHQVASGDRVLLSYGGTPQLARQILEGAPADIFIAAASPWMDLLAKADLLDRATRVDLLGNSLVLVGQPGAGAVRIAKGFDLAGRLGPGKLAMALVDAVPAGQYGKQALESLGVWAAVAPQVVQSENVRAALALVTSGAADMGVVYGSDAVAAGDTVAVLGQFPADSHDAITYPAARIAGAAAGAAFFAALQADAADAVFVANGFSVMAPVIVPVMTP
ncbi:MAG: molybdate ABC transporter substrate-binding protein [Pseudomonadota bacterium]